MATAVQRQNPGQSRRISIPPKTVKNLLLRNFNDNVKTTGLGIGSVCVSGEVIWRLAKLSFAEQPGNAARDAPHSDRDGSRSPKKSFKIGATDCDWVRFTWIKSGF